MRDVLEAGGPTPLGEASPLRFAGLVLNLDASTLARESGEAIPLTRGEFALLRVFVTRPGRVVSRDTLLDALANRRFEPFDRSVDVLIGRLRRKIEPDPKEPRLIVTVPGEGYRFDGLTKMPPSDQNRSISDPAPQNDKRRLEQDAGAMRHRRNARRANRATKRKRRRTRRRPIPQGRRRRALPSSRSPL
jgi:DNA-binding winged helix-turn-helix (wHTH) protein